MTKFDITEGHKYQSLTFQKGVSDKVWDFERTEVTKFGILKGYK